MPSKNKRMASRQSRVRERNRRRGGGRGARASALSGTAATQEIRRGVWRAPDAGESTSAGGAATMMVEGAGAQPAAASASQSEAITRRRSARSRTPSEPLPMYAHLGSELRRIAALTALTAVALAVLTFFLR